MQTMNVFSVFESRATADPDRLFLLGRTESKCLCSTFTYRNANTLVANLAVELHHRGLRKNCRILIVGENCCEIALLVLAALKLGIPFVVAGPISQTNVFLDIVAYIEPALVVLGQCAEDLQDHTEYPTTTLARMFDLAKREGNPNSIATISVDSFDPAGIFLTSGSSGKRRGIVASHDNLSFCIEMIQRRLQYEPVDVVGLFLPLSFDYGLYQLFLSANAGAALMIQTTKSVGAGIQSVLQEHRVSVLPCVPAFLRLILQLAERKGEHPSLARLKTITSTGEHVPVELQSAILAALPRVQLFLMYGLTECKRVSILLPEELARKAGTVGRPLDETSVKIVDENGAPTLPGIAGEIVVAGRNVCLEYWRAPEETSMRFRAAPASKSDLYTGDFGVLDCDGFLTIHGRCDSIVKRRGYRLSLQEIENTAQQSLGVQHAVSLITSSGRLVVVLSVRRREDAFSAAEFLTKQLETFKLPERVFWTLDSFPTHENGKTDYRAVCKLVEEGFFAQLP